MIFAPISKHERRDIENTLCNVYDSFKHLEESIDGVIWYGLSDAQDMINDEDDDSDFMSRMTKSNWVSFVSVKNYFHD